MTENELRINVHVDIVGGLDRANLSDRFKIMQNKDAFSYYLFNCLIYLFSEHVNGFFDSHVLYVMMKTNTDLFSYGNDEAANRSICIFTSLETFGFVKFKAINEDAYIRSTLDDKSFNYFCNLAKKFCKEFDQVLSGFLGIFKEWIIHSERKKDDRKS